MPGVFNETETLNNITGTPVCVAKDILDLDTSEIYLVVVISTLAVVTLVGNSMTLYVIKKHHLMKNKKNVIVASLAVSDISVGLAAGALFYRELVYKKSCWRGYAGLGLEAGIFLAHTASLLHVLIMALDRLCAVVWPLKYAEISTKRNLVRACVCVYAAAALNSASFFLWRLSSRPYIVPQWYKRTNALILYGTVAVILIITYTYIYIVARRHAKPHLGETGSGGEEAVIRIHTSSHRPLGDSKTLRVVLGIVLVYLTSWFSYTICAIAVFSNSTLLSDEQENFWMDINFQFGWGNASVNIFIYTWADPTFRRAYADIVRGLCPCCNLCRIPAPVSSSSNCTALVSLPH